METDASEAAVDASVQAAEPRTKVNAINATVILVMMMSPLYRTHSAQRLIRREHTRFDRYEVVFGGSDFD